MEWLILDGESRVTLVAKLVSVHEVWVATSRTRDQARPVLTVPIAPAIHALPNS
ncbi:MAG TPA: hypothetical protein VFZ72_01055 [Jiangellaceae bacterium]